MTDPIPQDDLVARLLARAEKQRQGRGDYMDYGTPDSELAEAADRITALETALKFYGDLSAWNEPPVQTREGLISVEYENQASKVRKDRGKIAREALAAPVPSCGEW